MAKPPQWKVKGGGAVLLGMTRWSRCCLVATSNYLTHPAHLYMINTCALFSFCSCSLFHSLLYYSDFFPSLVFCLSGLLNKPTIAEISSVDPAAEQPHTPISICYACHYVFQFTFVSCYCLIMKYIVKKFQAKIFSSSVQRFPTEGLFYFWNTKISGIIWENKTKQPRFEFFLNWTHDMPSTDSTQHMRKQR